MENSKVLKFILFLSGLLLIIIGGAFLFIPVEFSAKDGIELGNNISLLSNVRSASGVVMGSGILIMLGAFFPKLSFTSTVVSIVVFLSYGLSRILAIVMDGMPAEGLVKATVVEMILGLVSVFALLKYRKKE